MKGFTNKALENAVLNYKGGATFVGVSYEVDARVAKGGRTHDNPLWSKDGKGNDYFPEVTKKVETVLLFGFDYYNAIKGRLQQMGVAKEERERIIAEISEAPKGKKFVANSRTLLENLEDSSKRYIRFYVVHNPQIKTKVTYFVDGVEATAEQIENGIKPYLPKHYVSQKQQNLGILYNGSEIEPRDITIDNIIDCTLISGELAAIAV